LNDTMLFFQASNTFKLKIVHSTRLYLLNFKILRMKPPNAHYKSKNLANKTTSEIICSAI